MAGRASTIVDTSTLKYGDPVFVRWVDIHNDESGWCDQKDMRITRAEIETLGWWLAEDDTHYAICADIDRNDGQTNTRMFLPKGCVTTMRKIDLG